MRTEKQLTNNKYLNIKEIHDPEIHVGGYQYAERRGKDSIAFICYDSGPEQFLVNLEYKPPVNLMLLSAFGGSMDSNKTPLQIVIGELKEEAGYEVPLEKINYLGKVFVSTQMNQFCYLYLVLVDKEKQGERKPENAIEEMARATWISYSDIYRLEDWKAITIVGLAHDRGII